MKDLEDRYRQIRLRSKGATLIAVSKKQPLEKIEFLYGLGHRDFGENYVQDLIRKAEQIAARGIKDIRWHFIGNLQRNKVKQILPCLFSLHTLDSLKLAHEVEKRWSGVKALPTFIQINIDLEDSKSGIEPGQLPAFLEAVAGLKSIKLEGLMCIPKSDSGRDSFIKLKHLAEGSQSLAGKSLSMGMSQDYPQALACGATHIRVGSALFGPREP